MNDFKDILVYLRKRSGLSQLELAETLGLSKSAVSMYERGERRPSYEMLEALADYFNVEIDFLTGRDSSAASARLSPRAFDLASSYEHLDEHGKSVVDAIVRLEEERLEELNDEKET